MEMIDFQSVTTGSEEKEVLLVISDNSVEYEGSKIRALVVEVQ